jgi:hypothetical protein
MQAGRSFVAIEQHRNAGVLMADLEDGANLVSQVWTTFSS